MKKVNIIDNLEAAAQRSEARGDADAAVARGDADAAVANISVFRQFDMSMKRKHMKVTFTLSAPKQLLQFKYRCCQ